MLSIVIVYLDSSDTGVRKNAHRELDSEFSTGGRNTLRVQAADLSHHGAEDATALSPMAMQVRRRFLFQKVVPMNHDVLGHCG